MLRLCEIVVDGLCEICVKLFGFYPASVHNELIVEKYSGFTSGFSRFLQRVFHYIIYVFQSVEWLFLPIINIANNNDNNIKLVNSNSWRISV